MDARSILMAAMTVAWMLTAAYGQAGSAPASGVARAPASASRPERPASSPTQPASRRVLRADAGDGKPDAALAAEAATKPAAVAAEAATKPAESATPATQSASRPSEPRNVTFSFNQEDYGDVIRFIARCAGKPILGEFGNIQGRLTFHDTQSYTLSEAMALVNYVLRAHEVMIVDSGRYLEVKPYKEVLGRAIPIVKPGELDEGTLRDQELVTCILPLRYIEAQQAITIIARMVHTFGMLTAIEGNHALYITDTVESIRRIQSVLGVLDQGASAKQLMKYYKLKTASAEAVAKMIDQIWGGGRRGQQQQRFRFNRETNQMMPVEAEPSETVIATADTRSNTVIVVASSDRQKMVEELILQVDVDKTTGEGAVKVVALKKQKAVSLAKTLNDTFTGKPVMVGTGPDGRPIMQAVPGCRVVADEATNRLIISGTPDVIKQAEEMISTLDDPNLESAGLRIFKLKVASAANLVNVLQATLGIRGATPRSVSNFSVVADTRTNSLIVNGSAAEIDAVDKLIQQLDSDTPDAQREIHVVRITAGNAQTLAASLSRMMAQSQRQRGPGGAGGAAGEDMVRIEADAGTNSLMISAPPGEWKTIQDLLAQLTKEAPATVPGTRIFKLKDAKAPDVAGMLQRIFDSRQRSTRQGQPQQAPVVIAADAQSNALIVSATSDDHTEIETLLKSLDLPPADAAKVEVRVYNIINGNAGELSRALGRLFAVSSTGRRGPQQEPTNEPRFDFESGTNQLIVSATTEQHETIEKLIKRFQEEAAATAIITKPLQVKHARAEQLAPVFQSIMQAELAAQAKNSRGGPQGQARRLDVQVNAEPRTNRLLVTAPAEMVAMLEKLLPELDTPDAKVQVTKVLPLENADPTELSAAVNAALSGQPAPAGRGLRGPAAVDLAGLAGKRITVIPEQSARMVLLSGIEEDVAFAEKLIQSIDARPATDKSQVKTFKIASGRAEQIAAVLNSTIVAIPRTGKNAIPTRIAADSSSAIIVTAAGDVMEQVAELLKQIDVPGAPEEAPTIELVALAHARADQLASALNMAQITGQQRPGPRGPGQQPQADSGDAVRVTADSQSNSLLLTGKKSSIAKTKELITQLDKAASEGELVTELMELINADAAEVATVINAAVGGQQPAPGTARPGRASVNLAGMSGRKVSVVAAPTARAVLLSGEKADVAFAGALIKQLDTKPSNDKPVIKNIKLNHAKAEDLAAALSNTVGQLPGRPGRAVVPTKITPEKNANQLLVSALPEVVEQIEALVKQLDVEGADLGSLTIEMVTLKNGKAEPMAAALNDAQAGARRVGPGARAGTPQPGGDDVVKVTADAASNTLLLTGRPAQIADMKKLIAQLELATGTLTSETRVFTLQNAKAVDLAPVFQTILTDSSARGPRRPGQASVDVRVAWQEKANCLVVQGPPDVIALAADLVKKFDENGPGEAVIQIVQLSKSDAGTLSDAVNKALAEQAGPPSRTGPRPAADAAMVVPEPNCNAVLVRGTKEQVAKAIDLIKQLDQGGAGFGTQVRVFPLKNAQAGIAAKTLDGLFRQVVSQGRRAPGATPPAFSIAADERTNTVICYSSLANLGIIDELLTKMDADAEVVMRDVNYIPLWRASADDIVKQIDAMFIDRPKGERPTVTADSISNGITVIAKDADRKAIEAVVGKLDEENYITVKLITLSPQARAEKMAEVLKRVFEQISDSEVKITDRIPPRSLSNGVPSLFPMPAVDTAAGAATQPAGASTQPASQPSTRPASADRPPVIIAVDKGSNSLIVSAGRTEMTAIEDLVTELTSNVSRLDAEPKVIKTKNDPAPIAKVLTDLFNPRPVAGQPAPGAAQAARGQGPRGAAPQPAPAAAAAGSGVTIVADSRTRSLIVRAKPMELDLIEQMVKQLDESPTRLSELKIFPLKNADAVEVADNLRQIFGLVSPGRGLPNDPRTQQLIQQMLTMRAQRGAAAAPGQPPMAVPGLEDSPVADPSEGMSVSANRLTNSVIVAAPEDAMKLATQIIQQLDQASVPGAPVIKTIKLKNAAVADVVDAVSRIFAAGARPARARTGAGGAAGPAASTVITGNEATHTVIVSTRADELPLVEQVISELDVEGVADAYTIQIYHLERADARSVADAITRTVQVSGTAGSAGPAGPGRGGRTVSAADNLRISPEVASNSIVVRGTKDDHDRIGKLVKELDDAAIAGRTEVRMFKLKNAEVSEVVDAVTKLFANAGRSAPGAAAPGRQQRPGQSSGVVVAGSESSRSVIVSALPDDFATIEKVITDMDQAGSEGGYAVRVHKLLHGDARSVADALTRAMTQSTGAGPRNTARAGEALRISPEPASNAIVVRATAEDHKKIDELIAELDKTDALAEARRVVIPLTYAQADAVARSITASFAVPAGRGAQQQRPNPADLVIATAEATTNSLVVTASEANIQRIQTLVKEIDKETTGGRTMLFKILTNAKAVDVAKTLAAVAQKRGGARTGVDDTPTISAEPTANALVMSGKKADLDVLVEMAGKLDEAVVGQQPTVFIHPVKNANAVALADTVTRLYQQNLAANRASGSGKPVEMVAITADSRSNSLIVLGSKEQYDLVAKWINQIDEMGPARDQLRIINLQNARPDDVLRAIQTLYGSGGDPEIAQVTPPRQPRPAQPAPVQPRPVQPAPAQARPVQPSAAQPRTGGSVGGVAGGPGATMVGGQLIVNANDQDWKAIQDLVKVLEEAASKKKMTVMLFPLANAANTRIAANLNTLFRAAARAGYAEDVVTVTALDGTQAIVVTASAEKMDEVAALIKKLDVKDIATPQQVEIIKLNNAIANKMLPVLNQMLLPMKQQFATQQINVTVEPATNSLVVSTNAPVMDEIKKMIALLDAVPPFRSADMLIIPLKNADAPSLASVLTDMLTPGTGQIQTPEARALQEQIRLLSLTKGKEGLPPLDLTKPVKITSDPLRTGGAGAGAAGGAGSNSLIISSSPDNLQAMQEIVALLDTVPVAAGAKLQIIKLKNSDALAVMALLRDIFTQGRLLAGRPLSPTVGRAVPETVIGQALVNVLNITADIRTNTLVLAGTEETLALAQLIIKDLDSQITSEFTEVKLFKLKDADAAQLAPIIRAVFTESATPTVGAGGAAGGAGAPPAAAAGVAGARAYVTRLRAYLKENAPQQQPVESTLARTHPTLAVQAEAKANILIVAARSDLIPIIAELVAAMDVPGAGSMNVVRIYPLKNADATRMQTVINSLYTGTNANLIRPEDKPTLTSDTRTNSLIVSSSEKTFATIGLLLEKLDAELPIDLRDIRLVTLKNAAAATLTATLQRMMDARVQRLQSLGVKDAEALRVIIVADQRSNCLIVAGSAESYKVVADMAKQLDDAEPALSGQVQLIGPLVNANAGTLAASLVNLFNQRYQAAVTPGLQRQRPAILPDLRTNMLLISANQDDSKIITGLIAKLDAKPMNPAVELVVIPMKYSDSGGIGPVITRIFADRLRSMTPQGQQPAPQDTVSVEVDPLSNSLIVSASKENLVMVRELLAKVDVEPPTDSGIIKMYPLKYADVQRVSTMLSSLLTQGLYKPGLTSAANNAIVRAREKVAITTDLRTNVLIVSGSKENLNVIDQIIKSVDVEEGWGLAGNIQIYPLKNADATRLAPTLQQMFDRKRQAEVQASGGGQARSLAVVVIPDERTNSLLVAAGKEDSDSVAKLVETLDVSDVTRTFDFRVFYLKHATAAALEPTLRTLMSQRPSRGTVPTPVTISSNPKLNALIVAASRDDLAMAESLIAKLDVPVPEEGMTVQAFPAGKGDSLQLSRTLQSLYDAQKAPGTPSSVTFTADERSNTIFASAPKAEMGNIAAQIEKLVNGQANADAAEIRIFNLKHADATQLATILNDALTNKPKAITPVSQYRSTLVKFFSDSPEGKQLLSAIKEGVMVTPVQRTNSLLVQAPLDAMPLLSKLIDALDLVDPRSAEIKVFALVNADATQMAKVLSELFRIQIASTARQAARYAYGPAEDAAGATSRPAADLGATFGSAEQNALSITIDVRTNSLLVAGTHEYLELVGKVVTDLDASPAEDRQTMVYRLRNTKATDIETALRTFIAGERTLETSTLTAAGMGSMQELLARQVQVVAVPDTHAGVTEKDSSTLLVSGSPRFFKTVEAIIRELDQPPPQVLIDVLLAEVKLDDTTEFGVQWSLLGHPEKGPAVGSGTKFGLGSTGFNFTVSSGDFDLLLRALQSQGRLEVLSRPQILAIDNMLSRINVGDRVPFVTNSRIDVNGGVFNTIQYQDVGIILEVTPRINPDGFVKLQVSPEISSLSSSSVQISEGVSAPIINTRQAKTTVTVLDGHSIVIGGLITNKDEAREEKVPVLGDIPLLGLLFKSSRVVKERTELLIILTPRVERTSTQADVLTNRAVRGLQLVRSIHSDSGIGQVLNPLRGVSPEEVEQLESGKSAPPGSDRPVLIPLTPAKRETPTTMPLSD